ncbi:ATP-binding cassette domain-containing protein [Acidisoma cellulosilytica]|uniref:ATP-binding cassette domain-containing protein n=1 Tax=Acidisoma cellulosilyticum TaxID=2802395 RepID=A0A963Z550_9PROT|nr:ATP-binding cassette domain-containing protein [Acidisoma cellulosilyticum]MCB8882819.1 ATP-binding cassette domain-containing protein [Acidisoma cellulosilyticum]
MSAALACDGLTIRFGAFTALSAVSLSFAPRQIHAVCGQNGAGKTTFARACAGLLAPSAGTIQIGGNPLRGGHVKDARAAGVELVHQSFALPPSFTIAEAMEFGLTGKRGAVFTRRGLQARWRGHLEALGVDAKPSTRIRDLPVETQQAVEIARALAGDARVLILDEPTAVLAPAAAEALFERLKRLRDSGVTVLIILHKIREVLAVADTVSVLRGGKLVAGPDDAASLTAARIATAIIGHSPAPAGDSAETAEDIGALVGTDLPHGHRHTLTGPRSVAALTGVTTRPGADGQSLQNITLTVGAGEILGIAGVEGNGQRPLVEALAGLVPLTEGSVTLDGATVTDLPLAERRKRGLRIIPFERNTEGLSLSSPLWENFAARSLLAKSALSLIDPAALRRAAHKAFQSWDVRFTSVDNPARSLSGGNAQKVILSREMDAEAKLIILAQPTRGLDLGATAFVWQAMRETRDRGLGLILISSDLDELFDISDRLIVLQGGRIAGQFAPPYDLGRVGSAMVGEH